MVGSYYLYSSNIVFRYSCNSKMTVRFPDVSQDVKCVETNLFEEVLASPYQEISHAIAVAKRGGAPGEIFDPRGVAIDPATNHIYITEGVNLRVSIFLQTGEFIKTFTHKLMNSPWGIGVYRDNVYVTDILGNYVLNFKVATDIHLVARIGSKGSDVGQFLWPRQIAISTNGEVYVTDCGNHRIQILRSDLHFQRYISHHSMRRPKDVSLTPDEVYVLSDTDSPCVHVFSHNGNKIRSLITSAYVGEQVLFFCLDSSKNIIISYFRPSQVKIYSKEGSLLHTMGRYGNEVGNFYLPNGIALIDNVKLVIVSDNCNYGLQIFY